MKIAKIDELWTSFVAILSKIVVELNVVCMWVVFIPSYVKIIHMCFWNKVFSETLLQNIIFFFLFFFVCDIAKRIIKYYDLIQRNSSRFARIMQGIVEFASVICKILNFETVLVSYKHKETKNISYLNCWYFWIALWGNVWGKMMWHCYVLQDMNNDICPACYIIQSVGFLAGNVQQKKKKK